MQEVGRKVGDKWLDEQIVVLCVSVACVYFTLRYLYNPLYQFCFQRFEHGSDNIWSRRCSQKLICVDYIE